MHTFYLVCFGLFDLFVLLCIIGGSSRRASLRAESVREQGLCKRERRQDSVGRRLTAFDGLCVVIKTTADF